MRRVLAISVLAVLVGLIGLLGPAESGVVASNAGGGLEVAQVPADAPQSRDVILLEGWNLVGWTGDDVATGAVTNVLRGAFRSIHAFGGETQAFESVTAAGPSFLNSLAQVDGGDGLWLFSEGATRWRQPVTTTARSVGLFAGFNLVTWTGRHGTPIEEALAPLGGVVESAFTYEELSETFLSFGPALPPALNTLAALAYGEALWLRVSEARTWQQPAPPAGGVAVSGDGAASVTVPVGQSANMEVTPIDPADLPDEVSGQRVLAGYTVTNLDGVATAGLESSQAPLGDPDGPRFTVDSFFDVITEIAVDDVVQDGVFFDPNLALLTPNPAEQGGFKPLLNQETIVDDAVAHGGIIGWGQSTPTKQVFLVQDPGGISPPPGFNTNSRFAVDPATGGISVRVDGAYTGQGLSPEVRVELVALDLRSVQPIAVDREFDVGSGNNFVFLLEDHCEEVGASERRFVDVTVTEPEEKRGPVADGSLPPQHTLRTSFPAGEICGGGNGGGPGIEITSQQSFVDPSADWILSFLFPESDREGLNSASAGVDVGRVGAGTVLAPAVPLPSLSAPDADLFDMLVFGLATGGGPAERRAAAGDGPRLGAAQTPLAESLIAVSFDVSAEIPLDSSEHFYIFAAVFDRDAIESNNWVANPGFPLDFFQNSDAWYEATYNPISSEWRITRRLVIGGVAQFFATEATVAIQGNQVLFLIPRSELPLEAEAIPFRVSAFVYDKDDAFGQSQGLAAGDTFPEPTEPLALLPLP